MNIGRIGPKLKVDGITVSLGVIVVVAAVVWLFFLRK